MPNDNDPIEYALGVNDDQTIYQATVRCEQGINQDEFAAALISLGQDILSGKIDLDEFVNVDLSPNADLN